MSLNKKQKKQLDVIKKKLENLRPKLSGSKQQMDDPAEVKRLEDEIADLEAQARAIREEK